MSLSSLSLIGIIGSLTIIISLLVKIIGFPDQFRKDYIRKSTTGISFSLIALMFFSYVLWFVYGLLKNDIVIIIPNSLGILTSGAVFTQILIYRSRKK